MSKTTLSRDTLHSHIAVTHQEREGRFLSYSSKEMSYILWEVLPIGIYRQHILVALGSCHTKALLQSLALAFVLSKGNDFYLRITSKDLGCTISGTIIDNNYLWGIGKNPIQYSGKGLFVVISRNKYSVINGQWLNG